MAAKDQHAASHVAQTGAFALFDYHDYISKVDADKECWCGARGMQASDAGASGRLRGAQQRLYDTRTDYLPPPCARDAPL